MAYDLLAEEVSTSDTSVPAPPSSKLIRKMLYIPDLNIPQPSVRMLVQVDVDREMRIHISHLVLEAFCHADDEVVDECADGAEGSDIFAAAVVELDVDEVLLRVREADVLMVEVLGEFAAWAFDGDDAGLDVYFDWERIVC